MSINTTTKVPPRKWRSRFADRQQKQIEFARLYVAQFNHGADGHNSMEIISEMSFVLDAFDTVNRETKAENDRLLIENKELREKLVGAGIAFEDTEG